MYTFEDFQLYFGETWCLLEDNLTQIQGVNNAVSETKYEVIIVTYARVNGVFAALPARTIPISTFMREHKPFVPEYGYRNFQKFAIFPLLGSWRQNKKLFSTDRVEFQFPNYAEYVRYINNAKIPIKIALQKNPEMIEELRQPTLVSFAQALNGLARGDLAGAAISPDVAIAALMQFKHLQVFYKLLKIGEMHDDVFIPNRMARTYWDFLPTELKEAI